MLRQKHEQVVEILPEFLVGERRFELPTSWSRTKRATRLRYSPPKIKTVIHLCVTFL
jgi:hypothetical protein